MRLRFARRHETRSAFSRFAEGMFRDDGGRFRSRRRTANARHLNDRSRSRNERLHLAAFNVGRQIASGKRGKVYDAPALDKLERFGRYLDSDDDGIPYRTIPATHTTKGAFVARGSSRDEYAVYTEDSAVYKRNVDRLIRKWNTAKELVHAPEFSQENYESENGVLYFGTSTYAAEEAVKLLNEEGISLDTMRVRAFPFGKSFADFINAHEKVFVIEQNRDAQFKSLMMIELGVNPEN